MTTPSPDVLDDLIARLEAAEGADRRIDDNLHDGLDQTAILAPEYTASMDAAYALAKRVLPVWSIETFASGFDHFARARLHDPRKAPGASNEVKAETNSGSIPIALCLALCRALRQEASHG